MNQLDQFKDSLSEDIYGITRSQAHKLGLCIQCKQPALPRCYSDAGRKEYQISGLCEKCFDGLFE
jgi:hypothetical protein